MQLEVGNIVEGKVTGITKFGAFIELPDGKTGMVHISEISNAYVKEVSDHVQMDQVVKVKILTVSEDGKVSLSMKKAVEEPQRNHQRRPSGRPNQSRTNYVDYSGSSKKNEAMSFEDMMNKFKQSSDEKMSDLKRSLDSKRGGFSRRGSANPYK